MRHRGGRDGEGLGGLGGGEAERRDSGESSKQFFSSSTPFEVFLAAVDNRGAQGFGLGRQAYLREKCTTSLSPTVCRIWTRISSITTVTTITSVWKR